MTSIITVGAISTKFPLTTELNSAAAITGTGTYASSAFKVGTTGVLRRVTRLDSGTTTDTITVLDSAGNATALVFVRTGLATGTLPFDLGAGVAFAKNGFGLTITSTGTAGTWAFDFDFSNPVV